VLGLVGAGLLVGLASLESTRAWPVAVALGSLAAFGPAHLGHETAVRRRVEQIQLWPDAIEQLITGIRAGLSLGPALGQLAHRGPRPLRPAMAGFELDYLQTGDLESAIGRLRDRLADPIADQICVTLLITHQVGGVELGRALRQLARSLRAQARIRAELKSRQSWTVNTARLAAVAPWVVLVLLSGRPEAMAAYTRPAGALLLAGGGVSTVLAYWLMLRISRIPPEPRLAA
jgi:tight adherence protein B